MIEDEDDDDDDDDNEEIVCVNVQWCPVAFDIVDWWTIEHTDYRSCRLSN